MFRLLPPILMAAALCGQTPAPATGQKPPEAPQNVAKEQNVPKEVDAALRARVTQFYQLEVEAKFNQALQLVADDTKDRFVGANRPSYKSFVRVEGINYSDDFTKASVKVVVTRQLMVEGFAGHPLPVTIPSQWKLENGAWYWYIDPAKAPFSPFGTAPVTRMPPGPGMPPGAPSGLPAGLPATVQGVAKPAMLKVDKASLEFKYSGPQSAEIGILNPDPWSVEVKVADPKVPGLTIVPPSFVARPAGKTTLIVRWSGAADIPSKPVILALNVPRTKQSIPITVSFAK